MLPSLILNGLNVLFVAGCMVWGVRKANPVSALFRYFTTLSNVLCAIASLAVVIAWCFGELPLWVMILKFTGTAAVTVTMLTVFCVLGPVSHEWKDLLSGPELLLHLFCPLLAIVSLLVFERPDAPAWLIAIGAAPVFLYAVLYWYKVIHVPEERKWPDFYGFNRNGKWPLTASMMLLSALLISFALFLLCVLW